MTSTRLIVAALVLLVALLAVPLCAADTCAESAGLHSGYFMRTSSAPLALALAVVIGSVAPSRLRVWAASGRFRINVPGISSGKVLPLIAVRI